jgi:hypothetical protein
MCDIEKERRKIDAIIEMNISPFWFDDARNQQTLVDVAVRALCDDYGGCCPKDCIRSRCEAYIARNIGRTLM